jgi:hypothetical protein
MLGETVSSTGTPNTQSLSTPNCNALFIGIVSTASARERKLAPLRAGLVAEVENLSPRIFIQQLRDKARRYLAFFD